MKRLLRALPIPICGLILGMASLGNLLKSVGWLALGNLLGLIASGLMILVLLKLLLLFHETRAHLSDPIIASVAPTFTMGLMVICTYLVQFPGLAGMVRLLWLGTLFLHFGLMLLFTYRFVIKKEVLIEHIYPSWFIVYVGIGVISVTSGNFYPALGQIIFWVALGFYLFLLPFVLHRVFNYRQMAEATLPLITIIAAPGSLCLTGYLKVYSHPQMVLVVSLLLLSQLLYVVVLKMIIPLRRLPFYPSYAAFTFPLVISATALSEATSILPITSSWRFALQGICWLEIGIASFVVAYVAYHYGRFLVTATKTAEYIEELS